MRQTILIFSGIAVAIFLAFELSRYSLLGRPGNMELYIFLGAALLIITGMLLQRFRTPKSVAPEDPIDRTEAVKKSGLSKQEYTVLTLLAEGLSNNEIAQRLFIQESTVKSHVSKILLKLQAKRRAEAIKIGRDMQII